MTFAILKLSYNEPGDASLVGGICGTGFFLDSRTAITAHHVLNSQTLVPNPGYQHVRLWVIDRNGISLRLPSERLILHPEIDTSVIGFLDTAPNLPLHHLSMEPVLPGRTVRGMGHIGNAMPEVDAEWQGTELVIRAANLADVILDRVGEIKRPVTLTVNAPDVRLQAVNGFELSFGSQVGMSGGPVVDGSGSVLGMLSIGLPADANVKTQTFAISIAEIMDRIH